MQAHLVMSEGDRVVAVPVTLRKNRVTPSGDAIRYAPGTGPTFAPVINNPDGVTPEDGLINSGAVGSESVVIDASKHLRQKDQPRGVEVFPDRPGARDLR